jgi:hypothetical protein
MKLKWKNKLLWKETEYNYDKCRYVTTTYVHPIFAISTLIAAIPSTYFLCEWLFK